MKYLKLIVALLAFNSASAQIVSEGFENASVFAVSSTGILSGYLSGNSAAADRPATSPFAVAGTYAYGVNNGTTTIISEIYDTRCYTSLALTMRLAAFSLGVTTNGVDATDNVIVSISTDGGLTYAAILTVQGPVANNAYWAYTATGVATVAYPATATFAPAATGSRTVDGYSTLSITSLPATASLVVKIVAKNNAATELWTIDDFKITGTVSMGGSAPATGPSGITFSQIGCNAFLVSWTNGNGSNDLVAVKSGSAVTGAPVNGTGYAVLNTGNALFGQGNILNAAEYVVYNSSGGSVLIYGLNASTTYYISIWESNCYNYKAAGLTGNVTTTACSLCPQMNSVLIDGCNVTCPNEGQTEMAFFNSGSYSIPVNTNTIKYYFDQVINPPTQSYSEGIVSMPATITAMNTAGGCGSLFVDASTLGYIPPASTFLILTSAFCASDYNFANLCGLAPIYVVFTTSQNWNTSGNYTNNSCPSPNNKYFFADFSEAGITCVHYYYYDACLVLAGNGAYVTYPNTQTTNTTPAATMPPSAYGAGGSCTPPIVLPINLISFTAKHTYAYEAELNFVTAREENVKTFIISKSYDSVSYTKVAEQKGRNQSTQFNYVAYDKIESREQAVIYYRLEEEDFNGAKKIVGNCLLELKSVKEILITSSGDELNVVTPLDIKYIEIYTADGRVLNTITGNENYLQYKIDLTDYSKGFYIVSITDVLGKTTVKKVIR